tara:strand:+ start:1345 stop:1854 length:510 start_codon:yes stop_codon:yes gene_type:complete
MKYLIVILFFYVPQTFAGAPKDTKNLENACLKIIYKYNRNFFENRDCKFRYKRNSSWQKKKVSKILQDGGIAKSLIGKRDTVKYRFEREITCLDGRYECPPYRLTCFAKTPNKWEEVAFGNKIIFSLFLSNMSYNCDEYIHWGYEGVSGYLCDDNLDDNETYDRSFCTR